MPTLLRRIQIGIGAGAALWLGGTGCYESVQRPHGGVDANGVVPDASRVDASRVDASRVDASRADAARADASLGTDAGRDASDGLLPYMLSDLGCTPDGCCYTATCYTPMDIAPCLPTGHPDLPIMMSGDCEIRGPFAPNPDNFVPGICCYLTGNTWSFEGRPLFVEHTLLVAAVVKRSDWLLG